MQRMLRKETINSVEAARLLTGQTRSVSIEKLVKEIDWLSLSNRRNLHKLVTMFKIRNGLAPEYVNNILPPNDV